MEQESPAMSRSESLGSPDLWPLEKGAADEERAPYVWEAARLFDDESLAFVYVDGRHDYCAVYEDPAARAAQSPRQLRVMQRARAAV